MGQRPCTTLCLTGNKLCPGGSGTARPRKGTPDMSPPALAAFLAGPAPCGTQTGPSLTTAGWLWGRRGAASLLSAPRATPGLLPSPGDVLFSQGSAVSLTAKPQGKPLVPQVLGGREMEEERNRMNQKLLGKQQARFSVALGLVTIRILGNCPAEPDLAPGACGVTRLWQERFRQSLELEATLFFSEMRLRQDKTTPSTRKQQGQAERTRGPKTNLALPSLPVIFGSSTPPPHFVVLPLSSERVRPHPGGTSEEEDEDEAAPSCLAPALTALLAMSSATAMTIAWCPVSPLSPGPASPKSKHRADTAWVSATVFPLKVNFRSLI